MGHHRSHVKMPAAGSRQDRTRSRRTEKQCRGRPAPQLPDVSTVLKRVPKSPSEQDSIDKLLKALAKANTVNVRQLAAQKGCEFIQLGESSSGLATVGYRGWTKSEWDAIRQAVQAGNYEIRPAPQGGDVLVALP